MKAKEFIPASKPRNPVVRQQQTSGAGAHRDKKKEQKQGYEKHKNKGVAEVSKGTLDRYIPKAVDSHGHADFAARMSKDDPTKRSYHVDQKKTAEKRRQGISRALDRMSRNVDEQGVAEGSSVNEFTPAGGDGGNNYGGDIYDILMGYINENYPDLFDHFGDDVVDSTVSNMAAMGAFNDIDFNDEESIEDAVSMIINQLEEDNGMTERIRDPEDWDEGNTEPPNNFAIYINGKKWKVFKGRGQYADDQYEKAHFYQLKDWARKKSAMTGKKWEVYITGEPATE